MDVVADESPISDFNSKKDVKFDDECTYGGSYNSISDIDEKIERLKNFKLLSENEVKNICEIARDIFIEDGNVLSLSAPITICGDIHGQFHDLLELFSVGGNYNSTKYLFMGDFVDRGYYSVETFLLLILLKIKYPHNIFLIRGNHESRQITQAYGFYDECLRKYGSSVVWVYCTELFDYLSLAAMIDEKVFCVHGGLSPNLILVDQIRAIDRRQEVPHNGIMCDLLWSDPEEIEGWKVSSRGAGFQFGSDVAETFNETNGLEFICRAHQLVNEGYKVHFCGSVITVWSAPNYCYRCGNVASILKLDENLGRQFKIFDTSSEPEKMHPMSANVPLYFL